MQRARASEFPNDNPLLHAGAAWMCDLPCGPLEFSVGEASADEGEASPEEGFVREPALQPVAVESTPYPGPVVEAAEPPRLEKEPERPGLAKVSPPTDPADSQGGPEPAPFARDPFAMFVETLRGVLRSEGAASSADALGRWFAHGEIPCGKTEGAIELALVEAGLARRVEGGLVASDSFIALAAGWRGILSGSNDFGPCGETTLVEWAAEIVAAFLGAPHRARALQLPLRRHGIAAFGLVKSAA